VTGAEGTAAQPLAGRGRGFELLAASGFGLTALAGAGLAVCYALGGQPQAEGVLLALSLFGLGFGFVIWGHHLLPQGPDIQLREPLATTEEDRHAFEVDLERGLLGRRPLLTRTLGLAVTALGVAVAFPVRSLGPSPGNSLSRTPWKKGTRAVNGDGAPVRLSDVPVGGLVTVFPEGDVESGSGQTVLIRLEQGLLRPRRGRETWAPAGLVAYNKVCTHAGCPVGLYQAATHQLLCPCHQSAFDVLDGARPTAGPATRSLPQLPLAIDEGGFVVAQRDYTEPIGPAFWNRR
jgi:ubiquinol-cytochrome c reductase iron-sulfur subunit